MADYNVTVDYTDLIEVRKAMEEWASTNRRAISDINRANNTYAGLSGNQHKTVTQQMRVESSLRRQKEREVARESAAVERLAQKYKPLYAASQLYEKSLMEINQAHKLGVLNARQHQDALQDLNNQYTAFGNGTAQAGNMFVGAINRSNRSMSHFQVITQQAGYQVGDFLVQVQSGTNAFVAFGQQATQVAGTLTLLGGKWVMLGTALGIAIPLLTAIGAAFMRTRKAAKEADKSFDNLSNSINNLEKYSTDLIESNERIKDSFKGIIDVINEVETKALQSALSSIVDPLEDQLRSFEKRLANFRRMGGRSGGMFEPNVDILGMSNVDQIAQTLQLLRGIQGDNREEIAENLRLTQLWLQGSGLLTEEVKQLLVQYADAIDLQNIVKDNVRVSRDYQAAYTQETRNSIDQMVALFERSRDLREELGNAAFEALRLAGVDITKPISDAYISAAQLTKELNVSVQEAYAITQSVVGIKSFRSMSG